MAARSRGVPARSPAQGNGRSPALRCIDDVHDPAYAALACRAGTIFSSPEWLSLFGRRLKLYGIFSATDELYGACFFYESGRAGLKRIGNPPYTPHNGWIFENRSRNSAKMLSEQKQAIQSLVDFVEAQAFSLVRFSFPFTVRDMQPFTWRKFKVIPHYTYRVDLNESVAGLEHRMAAEYRRRLRQAAKSGVTVERIADYGIVRDLVMAGFNRKGIPADPALLEKILFEFANASNSYAFAAVRNGRPIATSLSVHDKTTAYYLLGGHAAQHGGAGRLCMWQNLLHAKESALTAFDFEGSMLQDVERYFRGFGGDLVPYFTINKAWLPLEFALKLVKRELF